MVEGTQACPSPPLHDQACGDPPSPPGPTPPPGPKPPPPSPPPAVFTLDLASPSTKDVTLTVQTPARITAKIIHSGGPVGGNVTLDISSFATEQGALKPVTLSVDGGADLGKSHLEEVAFTRQVLGLDLFVPELPAGAKYTGRLLLTPPGRDPIVWPIALTSANPPRPATVVLDQNAVTLMAVRWCLGWDVWETCDTPSVTIHARDKSGNAPLDGLVARLEPGLKFTGPGLRLMRQISVNLDGKEVRDFFTAPGSGERNVAAGGQASIKLAFSGFDPGEYTIPLRITARNSGDDDLQRLTVTLQVRNSAFVAALVLVVAGLISFAATRLVGMLRQRAQRLIRVRALQTAWLANEPAILPVIWLRAALRQTRRLSNEYWLLAGQDELDNRLNGAAGMLSVLDLVRQARQQIEAMPSRRVRLRATWKLDKVVERIPAMPLTDADVNRFKQDLATFDDWFVPDSTRLENAFWTDFAPALRALYGEVKVPANPTPAETLMKRWHEDIEKHIDARPSELELEKLQDTYERLAILWEARDHPAWANEIAQLPTDCAIDRVYKVIDDGWWSELNRLGPDQLRIVSPTSTLEPIEAFQTMVFQVRIDADPALADSYLVQKKLKYQWTIEIYDQTRAGPAKVLNVESTEPQIAQYTPTAGSVLASVRITYQGRQGPVVRLHDPIRVRASRDFTTLRIVASADMLAFGIALLASVFSGITLYALAPTFGSLKEYIALFTWAASFDQGKNFLQSLAAYTAGASTSTTTAATPAPTSASPAPAPTGPTRTPPPGGATPGPGGAPAGGPAGHG